MCIMTVPPKKPCGNCTLCRIRDLEALVAEYQLMANQQEQRAIAAEEKLAVLTATKDV
jgi:hypothetical protein